MSHFQVWRTKSGGSINDSIRKKSLNIGQNYRNAPTGKAWAGHRSATLSFLAIRVRFRSSPDVIFGANLDTGSNLENIQQTASILRKFQWNDTKNILQMFETWHPIELSIQINATNDSKIVNAMGMIIQFCFFYRNKLSSAIYRIF